MRKRPLALTLFSFILLGIAISLPVQAIYIQDLQDLFQSLTFFNILVMLLCTLTAVSAFKVHSSFPYLLPLTMITVVFNNWWVGYVGFNYDPIQTSLASLCFLIFCSVLLEKNTHRVLRNPKLKWWDVALRAKTQIPVSVFPIRGEALNKTSFDISESGIFLQGLDKEELERLNVGEELNVCLHFDRILKIRCSAKIVRKSAATGHYPTGIGLQFAHSNTEIRSAIKNSI
ncbi:PilZ domain-containing protein [bacterium]|nr:PilZ domain-containing protein [bacterium]